MTFEDFDRYQATILEEVLRMRDTKGREYANSESRFANFDRLAAKLKISRLKVAQVYYTKHLDALESYIDNGRTCSTETIHGRIVDLITYLTLVGGMIKEEEQNGK